MNYIGVGSTLICQDNRFLLIKAIHGPSKGQWNTPGGRVGVDRQGTETFEQCSIAEAKEETGYDVKLGKLIAAFHFRPPELHVEKKVYAAQIVGGELNLPGNEISDAKWFTASEIEDTEEFTFGTVQSVKLWRQGKFGVSMEAPRLA